MEGLCGKQHSSSFLPYRRGACLCDLPLQKLQPHYFDKPLSLHFSRPEIKSGGMSCGNVEQYNMCLSVVYISLLLAV